MHDVVGINSLQCFDTVGLQEEHLVCKNPAPVVSSCSIMVDLAQPGVPLEKKSIKQQEGQRPLTGQCAAILRLLGNQ